MPSGSTSSRASTWPVVVPTRRGCGGHRSSRRRARRRAAMRDGSGASFPRSLIAVDSSAFTTLAGPRRAAASRRPLRRRRRIREHAIGTDRRRRVRAPGQSSSRRRHRSGRRTRDRSGRSGRPPRSSQAGRTARGRDGSRSVRRTRTRRARLPGLVVDAVADDPPQPRINPGGAAVGPNRPRKEGHRRTRSRRKTSRAQGRLQASPEPFEVVFVEAPRRASPRDGRPIWI